jgi:hypothetical protein
MMFVRRFEIELAHFTRNWPTCQETIKMGSEAVLTS